MSASGAVLGRVVTPGGLIEDGLLAYEQGRIVHAGPRTSFRGELRDVIDTRGSLVTPGLIDCHTHLVFGGDRADEFQARMAGATYEEIARRGGGIASTVRHTRTLDEARLFDASLPRAECALRAGVTTIEIKSGYGLDLETERRMLRVARRIGEHLGITVRTTLLGLHAVPPERRGDPAAIDAYVDEVCRSWLPTLVDEGLVDAVDAYLEHIAFDAAQCRRWFDAARARGVPLKLHADQLRAGGGAQLAAECGALSADHLEHADQTGIAAMARAGSVAVLLPGAYYALRDTTPPPVGKLRAARVPMAVATDLNPGTSPLLSLPLAMNMACVLFGLTTEEAFDGVTRVAARALGLGDRKGSLAAGYDADFAIWPLRSVAELSYWIGGVAPVEVFAAGEPRLRPASRG